MYEKEVRSFVDQYSKEAYQKLLKARYCARAVISRILPDFHLGNFRDMHENESYSAQSQSIDGKTIFSTEVANSDTPQLISAKNAVLEVGPGWHWRLKRTELGEDGPKITGEGLWNLETGDAGFRTGRTFYVLGNAAIRSRAEIESDFAGGVDNIAPSHNLNRRTDSDFSMLEKLAMDYVVSQPADSDLFVALAK